MIEMSHEVEYDANGVGVAESIPSLPATVTGTSGTVYRAVNLLTELTTRQKNAARDCIASVLPTVLLVLKGVQESLSTGNGTVSLPPEMIQEMIRGIDIEAVFNAMLMDDLDVKLLATLYLPDSDRVFRADDVAERMNDLMDLSYGAKFGAFKTFFTMNSWFSPSTSEGFMQTMLTPKATAITK